MTVYASDFVAGLLDPDRPEPALLTGPAGKAALKRYAVYRNNVVAGLAGALEEIFPAVCRIVGEAFFAGMARAYLRACPPRAPLLFGYGKDFPGFVKRFAPARDLPYLADVARIERAWLDAYHAGDAAPLEASALAALTPQGLAELRLEAHPAMHIVRSRFAAHTIFAANRGDAWPERIDAGPPEDTLICRPRLDVVTRRLPPGAADFLEALARGETLSDAVAAGLSQTETFDPEAAIGLLLETGALRPRDDRTSSIHS